MKKLLSALAGLSISLAASTASAAVLIEFTQVNGDIMGTATGSLDLSGVSRVNNNLSNNARLNANRGEAVLGVFSTTGNQFLLPTASYSLTTNYGSNDRPIWGTNDTSYWPEVGDATGDRFGIALAAATSSYANKLFLPQNSSGTVTVNSTALYKNLSFGDLGVTAGNTYDYWLTGSGAAEQEGRRVTVSFAEATVIPLPATALLMLSWIGGVGGLSLARRRKK